MPDMIADYIWYTPLGVFEALYRATPVIGGKPSPLYKAVRDAEIVTKMRNAGASPNQIAQVKKEVERIDAANAGQPDAGLENLKRLATGLAVMFIAYYGFKLYIEFRKTK